MKRVLLFAAAAMLAFRGPLALAQTTSAAGNLDIYTQKTGGSEFGLLRTTVVFPAHDQFADQFIRQQGILYTHTYGLGAFDPIVFGMNDQLQFGFEGIFRLGVSLGSADFGAPWGPFKTSTIKYYVGVFDPFALDVGASYTHMFRNGMGLTARGSITIVNVGADVAMMQKGTLKENGIVVANLLPVEMTGSVFFDFGRSGLGVQYYINASNLLSFVAAPADLYTDDNRGVVSRGLIKKYGIQLMYVY